MENKYKFLVVFYFTLFIVTGCEIKPSAPSNAVEENFQAIFPQVAMGDSFQLNVVADETTPTPNSEIRLSIINKSTHFISFPPDSDVKLFVLKDSEWVEVRNKITYSGLLQLYPQGTLLKDTRTSWVHPVLDDNMMDNEKKEILLRIVMVGEIVEEDVYTGVLVGAYVDVFLVP